MNCRNRQKQAIKLQVDVTACGDKKPWASCLSLAVHQMHGTLKARSTPMTGKNIPAYELSLTRIIEASPEKLYRAWTEPDLLKIWFCPAPWRVSEADLDLRPGGRSVIIMNGPDGEVVPNAGVYL